MKFEMLVIPLLLWQAAAAPRPLTTLAMSADSQDSKDLAKSLIEWLLAIPLLINHSS
jgi:hypothetical protein